MNCLKFLKVRLSFSLPSHFSLLEVMVLKSPINNHFSPQQTLLLLSTTHYCCLILATVLAYTPMHHVSSSGFLIFISNMNAVDLTSSTLLFFSPKHKNPSCFSNYLNHLHKIKLNFYSGSFQKGFFVFSLT